jgi:hypothetical protein
VGLTAVNRDVLAQVEMRDRADRIVLDMDSSESPLHGQQEGSAYNGHFESVYYHRMPANENLEWEIAELLFRPPGRPSRKPLVRCKSFQYQAGSWTQPRRIVAKVEHHAGVW